MWIVSTRHSNPHRSDVIAGTQNRVRVLTVAVLLTPKCGRLLLSRKYPQYDAVGRQSVSISSNSTAQDW
jgi:hypothetical protein